MSTLETQLKTLLGHNLPAEPQLRGAAIWQSAEPVLGAGRYELRFVPRMRGDYDGNLLIDEHDLKPLSIWYGARSDHELWEPLLRFYDGDGNGEIGNGDIAVIAGSYGATPPDLRVEFADGPDGPWQSLVWPNEQLTSLSEGQENRFKVPTQLAKKHWRIGIGPAGAPMGFVRVTNRDWEDGPLEISWKPEANWNPNQIAMDEQEPTIYEVYRDTLTAPIATVDTTNYIDPTAEFYRPYQFWVRAIRSGVPGPFIPSTVLAVRGRETTYWEQLGLGMGTIHGAATVNGQLYVATVRDVWLSLWEADSSEEAGWREIGTTRIGFLDAGAVGLAEVGGRLALAYVAEAEQWRAELHYAVAKTIAPHSWDDFESSEVFDLPGYPVQTHVQMIWIDGSPHVTVSALSEDDEPDNPYYYRRAIYHLAANAAYPDGKENWTLSHPARSAVGPATLTNLEGRPALSYYFTEKVEGVRGVRFSVASSNKPTDNDWRHEDVHSATDRLFDLYPGGRHTACAIIDGTPCVSFIHKEQLMLAYRSSTEEWQAHALGEAPDWEAVLSLTSKQGKFVLCTSNFSSLRVLWGTLADLPSAQGADTWSGNLQPEFPVPIVELDGQLLLPDDGVLRLPIP